MEGHDYDVHWVAWGMDFRYSGIEKVWAIDKNEAKTKAKTIVSRKMCLARQLVNIEKIEIG